MQIFDLFDLDETIQVMDVGASAIAETPIYKVLLEMGIGHLTAFDGDARQVSAIKEAYGSEGATVLNHFLFDGDRHKVYLCSPESGMTSIFKPKADALDFFNGFARFGEVHAVEEVQTTRLDDIEDVNPPDFLKMDVQGAELGIIQNGTDLLANCLAMQLEVSFFALYEGQPSFGDIDVALRQMGFVPHRFLNVKRWSISPTIFKRNFRVPGNQLLEADVVYIRDPLNLASLSEIQLQKLAVLAHFAFKSVDYCVFLILEMERRGYLAPGSRRTYLQTVNSGP